MGERGGSFLAGARFSGDAEDAYRSRYLDTDYRQFRVFAIVALAGLAAFIRSDYIASGPGTVFLVLVGAKILFSAGSAVLLFALRRVSRYRLFDVAVLVWTVVYSTLVVAVDQSRPPDYTGHFLVNLLNLLGFYFLIPNTAFFRALSALFFTALVFAGLGMDAAHIPPMDHFSILVSFALGNLVGIVGSGRAERQRRSEFKANAELRELLEKDERLVRETNHRVKNNLTAVDSLLSLQASEAGNEALREKLEESRARLQTIRLIHESLYRSPSLEAVELCAFLRRLARELLDLYRSAAPAVALAGDCAAGEADPETAMSCGMIVTELVTNSLKHAFPGGRAGSISLDVRMDEGRCSVSVRDDGVGLPAGFDPDEAQTMGMIVVTGYVKQLRGTLSIEKEKGAAFRFDFPLRAASV